VNGHNVVFATLPAGEPGGNSAAQVAIHLQRSFPSVKVGLMVGIGGGVPGRTDIRLGDIVVSKPTDRSGSVFQFDMAHNYLDGFKPDGLLNAPPRSLRAAVSTLEAWHGIPGHNLIPTYISTTHNDKIPSGYSYALSTEDELFRSDYIHAGHATTCKQCDRSYLVTRSLRSSLDPVVHYGIIASGNQVMKNASYRDMHADTLLV
jgi:hypothetical protein